MKDTSSREPLLAEELRASPQKRRRKHAPKPNFATWLILAWLAFMAAWGCKHLYRQWEKRSNSAAITTNVIMPAEALANATVAPATASAPDSAGYCPLK